MTQASFTGTREAFSRGLYELAQQDDQVTFVAADSLMAVKSFEFAAAYPERFFDVGIAEQHAVGFAAGLATCGLKPWVGTYAGFITMRACEQVRTFVAYPELNVKFVGLNGGIYGGEREGVTHQFFEDLAIMRAIPGMDVVVPCDAEQVRKATHAMGMRDGPGYLRVGSGREPIIFDDDMGFEFGKARIIKDYGTDAAVFVCGPVLARVMKAADQLKEAGIGIKVVEVHTLKPLDSDFITEVLEETTVAVSVEDHTVIGGLGSAIAEVIAERAPAKLTRLGLQDVFPESGDAEALLDAYGMSINGIADAVKKALNA